jgi:predicted neuraminidase
MYFLHTAENQQFYISEFRLLLFTTEHNQHKARIILIFNGPVSDFERSYPLLEMCYLKLYEHFLCYTV